MTIKIPYNGIYKKQNDRLIPQAFAKAIISAVYPTSRTADVYFVNNPNTIVRGIPMNSIIPVSSAILGYKCRVDIFDVKNQKDMVVSYVYGGNLSVVGQTVTITYIKTVSFGGGGSTTSGTMTFTNGILVAST